MIEARVLDFRNTLDQLNILLAYKLDRRLATEDGRNAI